MRPLIVLVLALTVPSLQAAAASSDLPLRDYVHTVWTQHDGLPLGTIVKIFQTTDGYLWIATRDEGLLRFDGMRFVRVSTPCTERVWSFASAPDGGFWLICDNRLFRRSHGASMDLWRTNPVSRTGWNWRSGDGRSHHAGDPRGDPGL
jgi:ligand-binding sensor domain-containing protein